MNIRDLAKIAGVSTATVSIVLNGKPGVGHETRKKILEIAAQNGYSRRKKQKEDSVGVLFIKYRQHGMLVEENQGFIATIVDAIEQECRRRDCPLNMVISEGDLEATLLDAQNGGFKGIIVLGTELEEAQYPLLLSSALPLVVVDNNMAGVSVCAVGINNRENIFKLTRYCASQNFDHIGYIKSRIPAASFKERLEAFERCMNQLNLKKSEIISLTPTLMGAYNDMKDLLAKGFTPPDCMIADNDTIAIGAIKALREHGISVPGDVSVVGFDDIPFSSINSPPLTTINVPKALIGKLAVEQLFHLIKDARHRMVCLQVEGDLVLRDSIMPKSQQR